jgi:hypothetical protein
MSVIISCSTDVGYKTSTNSLSLYLDARNPNSYPGTGTTWYDLSVGAHDSSTALATYSSTSPASFSITSPSPITPIVNFTASVPTSVFTIETVIKPTSLLGYYVFLGFNYPTFAILFDTNSNMFYWPGDIPNSSIYVGAVSANQWQYFVFELRGSNSPSNSQLYKNGNLLNSSGGTNPLTPVNYNNGMGQIYGDTQVSCSIFRTYNRTLTQAEITTNYNYFKPIFNLS